MNIVFLSLPAAKIPEFSSCESFGITSKLSGRTTVKLPSDAFAVLPAGGLGDVDFPGELLAEEDEAAVVVVG
jgi:hypothetical protein